MLDFIGGECSKVGALRAPTLSRYVLRIWSLMACTCGRRSSDGGTRMSSSITDSTNMATGLQSTEPRTLRFQLPCQLLLARLDACWCP